MATSQPSNDLPMMSPFAFRTTRWSVVVAAQGGNDFEMKKSLASLCEQYWMPIYAYVRRRGHPEHDAQDMTQAFFARLLEKNWLAVADKQRGRFRTFLLTAVNRFLANEWDRKQSLKRGGRLKFVNIDPRLEISIADAKSLSPEVLFERQWALTVLESVMNRLHAEFANAGRTDDYELLKPCLTAARNTTDYNALAVALGVQPVSARSAVHRLRKRFKEVFREEIAHTVADAGDVENELNAVIAALRSDR